MTVMPAITRHAILDTAGATCPPVLTIGRPVPAPVARADEVDGGLVQQHVQQRSPTRATAHMLP